MLKAEQQELGITAGLQDRVIQVRAWCLSVAMLLAYAAGGKAYPGQLSCALAPWQEPAGQHHHCIADLQAFDWAGVWRTGLHGL